MKALLCLFVILVSASAITLDQVQQCVNANCTKQLSACDLDSTCNAALSCFEKCDVSDQNCRSNCASSVRANQPFWALDFCTIACIAELESEEHDPVQQCELNECAAQADACSHNTECLSVARCIRGCHSKDYECGATCITPHGSNPYLLNLIRCQSQCFWNYVHN